jgi:DNA-binding NarL/FixJ family response regulator
VIEKTVRVLLADDHTILRQGLAILLESEPDFTVVGEASDGLEAVRKVEESRPDVVVMDIGMPRLNGIEAARQIMKMHLHPKILILSQHAHERFVSEALYLGASGYLLKNTTGPDIIRAIRAAMKGDTFLSPEISRQIVEEYLGMKRRGGSQQDLYSTLTNREREVFQMIAEGRTVREISEILFLSVSTVKTHRSNIMEKLKLKNMSELVQLAVGLGLVEVESL